MDPSVDWNAFKVWGSVSLVALVVLIGGLIWCWCWCCRCCCDSCGRCSRGNCTDDCHCSCCSRVKKENNIQPTCNEGLELGGPATGVHRFGVGILDTVSRQVHLHSSTEGEPSECSFSFEDETKGDRRMSPVASVAHRHNHGQEQEKPDDVTPSVKEHNSHIPKDIHFVNYGRDNEGYETDYNSLDDSNESLSSIRHYNDEYNSEGLSDESSSEDEKEVRGFKVGDNLMKRHVIMTREMPLDMSIKEKENFAYQKARPLYKYIPWKYTLIRIESKEEFRRKILKEAIPKAVGLDHFTTTESFDIVDFYSAGGRYMHDKEGQARLILSCNPEQVVNHLAGVVF